MRNSFGISNVGQGGNTGKSNARKGGLADPRCEFVKC